MKVYLSGGMREEWRNNVKDSVAHFVAFVDWIDPTKNNLINSEEYTAWDLLGVRMCDICFAYLEKDNPSGLGLMLEIGYAKAQGKLIIFVDERQDKYTAIGRRTADCVYNELDDGIGMLVALLKIGL